MSKSWRNSTWAEENIPGGSYNLDGSCSFIANDSPIAPLNNPNKILAYSPEEYFENILDPTLNFISQILLEAEVDSKVIGCQEEIALRAMEKSFFDLLGQNFSSSPNEQTIPVLSQINSVSTNCLSELQVTPRPTSKGIMQNPRFETITTEFFQKGVEEGIKFLPKVVKPNNDFQTGLSLIPNDVKEAVSAEANFERDEEPAKGLIYQYKGKKNPDHRDLDILEGRNHKITMRYSEEPVRDDIFDKVLLCDDENYIKEEINSIRELMQSDIKDENKNETQWEIDLIEIILQCSQAVATNDRHVASELIKQIKKHSSPTGDGVQRLACIFVDGLEARLNGSGSELYHRLISKRTTTKETLKAHQLKISTSPFPRFSFSFANLVILKAAEKATKLHIIDFGIGFGFQWPSLIQCLSKRQGKAVKLRITGVDFPRPGFRPAERLNETGRRLKDYAETFTVPFEYACIASKWETLGLEDFNIEEDEVVVVNSLYCFRKLGDETISIDSARTRVLNLIREIKPSVFILGILNSLHSGPVFVPRFRQILFYCSTIFDMMDATIPRDNKERKLLEWDHVGRHAINVIACEGSERVERPESYKQWQRRILRAGFEQLPVDAATLEMMKGKVREFYDGRFFLHEDSEWLIQGWKGRVVYAISTWKPKEP